MILYWGAAKIGLKYAVINQTVTLLWPPSGIALAAVLLCGYRIWPGIALGALLANAESDLPIYTLLIITIGDTLEPILGGLCLRGVRGFSIALDKVADVFKLVLFATFGCTVIGATFGAVGLLIGGEIDSASFWAAWFTWWLGDGMGVLVISPVILCGSTMTRKLIQMASLPQVLELLILAVVLIIIGHTIFGSKELAKLGYFPTALTMFPFAIWSALRFGSLGAAGVALASSLLAIDGTVKGVGPFAVESKIDSLILWCVFADLMAITGLILAAVDSGRKTAVRSLKMANEYLDRQVRERTNELLETNIDLYAALAERRRYQLEMSQISEDRHKMIGQELHDGLGQQLTGIAFLVSSIHQTLAARSAPEASLLTTVNSLLSEAMAALRALSRGLYPIALESGGLSSALDQLAEYTQNFSGIRCIARCVNGVELDKIITLNLYRIVQEAVNNALRHSKAQKIEINLIVCDDQYILSIIDDGIGFSRQNINVRKTLGFRSMQNRAHLVGAVIEIRKNEEGGTSIVISGPLKPVEDPFVE